MSSTEAGQAAHVNACLDAAAAAHEADPPVDTATDAAAALAPEDTWEQQQQQESEVIDVADVDDDVASWLDSIGAAAVAGCFAAAEVDLSVLPHLNEHDLEQPLQPKQRPKSQMQLGQGGRLQQPPQPQPQQPRAADQQMLASLPSTRSGPLPSWWPAWRCLPGTSIIVDAFGQSSKALGGGRTWVLTHFHADHYMGLGKGFKQGRILCTPATAALVRLKLRVPEQLLVPLPLGQEISVEGTRLQFVDANHCPGSAMVVAQPPGGLPPVLHTGDARLTREATQQQPALQALVGRAVLVLDTTYADPSYCFPPQQEVLQWVLRAVQAESFNPRCLFLFGSYTIGKERLFLHVAAALRSKVYVAAAKRSILACLDLPPEQAALLTTNHLEANIHVVPMRQVTLEAMESLLLRYKGRYTAVVGFQPTGWSHTAGGSGRALGAQASRASSSVKGGKRLQRGTVVLYKVPYSEHSSCAELREFVAWLKPIRIIPSVSNNGGDKLRKMLAAVTSSGKASGPMDAWVQGQQQQQQQALQ
ncbi:hypothetical protein OEZ86_000112 [Tetradesmus obliquus]|nr:hypothetical protein OEZ86_000112 [Tetradesmus obliquus]